jgi:hypothetical protein
VAALEPRVLLLAPFHSNTAYIIGRIKHPDNRLDVAHVGGQPGGLRLAGQELAAQVSVKVHKLGDRDVVGLGVKGSGHAPIYGD